MLLIILTFPDTPCCMSGMLRNAGNVFRVAEGKSNAACVRSLFKQENTAAQISVGTVAQFARDFCITLSLGLADVAHFSPLRFRASPITLRTKTSASNPAAGFATLALYKKDLVAISGEYSRL